MIHRYTHETLNTEINALAGHYFFDKEVRLPFHNREVFYLVGYALIDKSCCGPGGCSYALVPGFVISWKSRHHADGRPISEVEVIEEPSTRQEVIELIRKRESINQVQFL